MSMDTAFLDRVAERSGHPPLGDLKRVMEATLQAVGRAVPPRVMRDVAGELPEAVSQQWLRCAGEPARSADAFYRQVAEQANVTTGLAVELSQLVCEALAEQLGPDATGKLKRELPDEIAALLQPPRFSQVAAPAQPGHGHSLADGRSGGSRPISAAKPGSRHPVSEGRPRASQGGSVADANPHGETKLSSTHGLTQEREHDTLAEGRSKRS